MYQAVYKCRLCGEEYEIGNAVDRGTATKGRYELRTIGDFLLPRGGGIVLRMIMHHNCQDGSLGLADFMGFKKAEE